MVSIFKVKVFTYLAAKKNRRGSERERERRRMLLRPRVERRIVRVWKSFLSTKHHLTVHSYIAFLHTVEESFTSDYKLNMTI